MRETCNVMGNEYDGLRITADVWGFVSFFVLLVHPLCLHGQNSLE
jgi:hypothetical protein